MAVAPNAIASAVGTDPRFETSDEAVVHMEDDPAALSAAGTPNTVAAPVRSLFQTNCTSLKLTFDVAWTRRASAGVAWMEDVLW